MARPMKPVLRKVRDAADLAAAKSVRLRVFVDEQGVPPEIEMDEYDSAAVHVICLLEEEAVGTGRLVEMPDGMKLGRVAVMPEHRDRGFGALIVKRLLDMAARSSHLPVYANVQVSAVGFYEKLGFKSVGPHFSEAGIEHVRMIWSAKST